MRSKHLKSYNIPYEDAIISSIDAKPSVFFLVLTFAGFGLLASRETIIYGVLLIVLSILFNLFLPGCQLIAFYKDYMILYNKADRSNCELIYYDEVASWNYTSSVKKDQLTIELEDGSAQTVQGFSKRLFESRMKLFLKDKQRKNS